MEPLWEMKWVRVALTRVEGACRHPRVGKLRKTPQFLPTLGSGICSSWLGCPWRTLAIGWVQGRWDWISGLMNIH